MPSPSREIYGFSHQTASLGAGLHPQVHQCRAGPLEPDGSPFVARTHFMGAAQTASTRCSRRDSKATVSARSAASRTRARQSAPHVGANRRSADARSHLLLRCRSDNRGDTNPPPLSIGEGLDSRVHFARHDRSAAFTQRFRGLAECLVESSPPALVCVVPPSDLIVRCGERRLLQVQPRARMRQDSEPRCR